MILQFFLFAEVIDSYSCQGDRASACVYLLPAFTFVCGYMHMHKGCLQSSHACVGLWHSSKIVFAAHSHEGEGSQRSFSVLHMKEH